MKDIIYAANIVREINNIESRTDKIISEEERTEKIKQLQLIIKNVVFTYGDCGQIMKEDWLVDGMRSRNDGPALVKYYENGKIKHEEWYKNDILHRDDGPASIMYYKDGERKCEQWFLDGDCKGELFTYLGEKYYDD